MARVSRRSVLVLGLALLSPGCASKSSAERAGIDQEIARNILWRFHKDPTRFNDVRVACEDRVVTLEGRVSDARSASDALQIALSEARGGRVESRLEVRPR
ncbi:MAG: BON domain-containing protein [Planctomycetaceae bacterium]|nr:BON domain-containing protein [Planctomycetaceae bacterium]